MEYITRKNGEKSKHNEQFVYIYELTKKSANNFVSWISISILFFYFDIGVFFFFKNMWYRCLRCTYSIGKFQVNQFDWHFKVLKHVIYLITYLSHVVRDRWNGPLVMLGYIRLGLKIDMGLGLVRCGPLDWERRALYLYTIFESYFVSYQFYKF